MRRTGYYAEVFGWVETQVAGWRLAPDARWRFPSRGSLSPTPTLSAILFDDILRTQQPRPAELHHVFRHLARRREALAE
jgi:hypothetical protein